MGWTKHLDCYSLKLEAKVAAFPNLSITFVQRYYHAQEDQVTRMKMDCLNKLTDTFLQVWLITESLESLL